MWISVEGRTAVAHADETLTFSNRRELARLAAGAVDRGARTVVVDLGATAYVDTAALGMLATLAHRVRMAGGTFHLTNVRPELAAALASLRLDTLLPTGAGAIRRAD